ncbi:alkylbase DNA glycosidase-like protein mag2 [Andrographis paniculata]|uniref:alkylbase DNA glycosidase-like protein mag2 n=1 Tax=Andrographis paniculata TaxID=175694 RepID=UPI0021E948FE|nr:alkylbase DNA glycosidase-like protein mag2 [Andrographis paniculata]
MGEQTRAPIATIPKSESQIETPKSQQQSELQSLSRESDSITQISYPPPTETVALEDSPAIAAEISHHNPCKIPVRPPKIRKLSTPSAAANPATGHNPSVSSSSSIALTTSSSAITPAATNSGKHRRRSGASQGSRPLPQIIKPLSADGEVELAIRHLRAADPLLCPLIDSHPPPQFDAHHLPFLALTRSILYQQLAFKAGTSIYTRFVSLCGGEASITPDSILTLSSQQLKQIGVSARKASYLYDLANKYKSGILSDDAVVKMDDRSLFTMLSMVKGIGSWSVHMFMIFSLHRPDVLPVSDLGVRKGVQLLYCLEELPRPSQMEHLCEKWRPYRSVGAWYMWRFVEGKGGSTASGMTLEGNAMQQQKEPQQDEHQHQHQLQFLEPVNGISNMGACIWNQ